MNILEYAIARKLFGGSGGGTTDDSIVGTWVFNDVLTPINKPFEEGFEEIKVPFVATLFNRGVDGYYPFYYDTIIVVGDPTLMEEVDFATYNNNDLSSAENAYYFADEGWGSGIQTPVKITFLADTNDTVFKEWLKANATKLTNTHTLYSRENGEWVSKGEI
jgi:hypothetical protein